MSKYEKFERDCRLLDCTIAGWAIFAAIGILTFLVEALAFAPMQHEDRTIAVFECFPLSLALCVVGAPIGRLFGYIREASREA